MKIFQTPSYDRFCLFEMERKSKDFRGMDDNVAYKNKQIDNVEISNEGRRALREKLREVKPKVEEPDRKSTRLNSSHDRQSRMPSSA